MFKLFQKSLFLLLLCCICSAICPDFFVGKEPWSPSQDWSTFQQWLEDKKPTEIKKYRFYKLKLYCLMHLKETVIHLVF